MLLEWDRFVMAVKLNRGLKESNHDQLYAYLKQHKLHANENKMLMERLNQHSHDPLSLVSNVSPYQYPSSSSVPPQPSYISPVTHQPQFADNTPPNTGLSPADELLDSLTNQVFRMAGLWFRMFRGDKTGFKETMLGVLLLQGIRGVHNRAGNVNVGKGKPIKCYNCNGIAQENGVDLDEEQLLFLAADQCDAFDSDVDEAPTAQTMFMVNLSSAGLVYDKAGPSYDSDTISKVQDHEKCLDNINVYLEEHEMQNDVQPNNVFDSDTEYTSNSNIISYEQYVQENEEQVVQSNVSFVPNDAVMMITNDIHE
ncbi:hypothetical protein Tco_1433528 [Tanacetum coccineum]